jgi:hypothetical protein
MIKPTIGRIVWYWPSPSDITSLGMSSNTTVTEEQPMAAQVVYVHSDHMVNLSVIDHGGEQHARTSVLLTDDKPIPTNIAFATWMPYQVNQAKKEEASATLPTDADIEREIQAKGLTTAPRITPADIEALMARVQYLVPAHAGETTSTFVHAYLDGTFYLASGHSACVSLENFDEATGIRISKGKAQAAARDKLWELEGYALFKSLNA